MSDSTVRFYIFHMIEWCLLVVFSFFSRLYWYADDKWQTIHKHNSNFNTFDFETEKWIIIIILAQSEIISLLHISHVLPRTIDSDDLHYWIGISRLQEERAISHFEWREKAIISILNTNLQKPFSKFFCKYFSSKEWISIFIYMYICSYILSYSSLLRTYLGYKVVLGCQLN